MTFRVFTWKLTVSGVEQVTENTEEEGREPGGPAPGPRESGLLWDPVLLQVSLHCRLNIKHINLSISAFTDC